MFHFRMDMPIYLMAMYGSIMIAVVLLLRVLLKNKLPRFVFPKLWGLALIRLLVPFSLSSPISAPVPELNFMLTEATTSAVSQNIAEAGTATDAAATVVSNANAVEYGIVSDNGFPVFNWAILIIVIYCMGIAVTAGILCYQKVRYSKKLNDSLLVEHNEIINRILRDMGFGHVLIFTNDHIASPLVSGILNPRIYLPSGMVFQNAQLLRHILTHEAMHIKRKDNWIKAVMLAAICIHWYNPLVWMMSNYLSADIEAACDAAVLKYCSQDERQSYAFSLLTMAITGNRRTLLYSAFSKTEVERRVKGVLNYKKATAFVLALSLILLFSGTIVFATGGQAPFSEYLSSYCGSSDCRWAVKAELARDIALGENPQRRADNAILNVLGTDDTNNPDIIKEKTLAALSRVFGVEKSAFKLDINLSLDDKTLDAEYAAKGITKDKSGRYLYKNEPVRIYEDEILRSVQTHNEGMVDIAVIRDRMGQIVSINAWHKGDSVFDRRSDEITENRRYNYNAGITQGAATAVEWNG